MARLCWGAFGHGMPCPYWGEVRKNEIGAGAKDWQLALHWCAGAGDIFNGRLPADRCY
jgi:hypothetical protein